MKYLIFFIFFTNLFSKEILGEIDKFNLPLFNLNNIEARIDTGAKTSSIHATKIEIIENKYVKFLVLGKYQFLEPVYKIQEVKSSNGQKSKRVFIKNKIEIFDKDYEIILSLNDRKNMKFPLLIGRELLEKGFIVDVSKQNLSFSKID